MDVIDLDSSDEELRVRRVQPSRSAKKVCRDSPVLFRIRASPGLSAEAAPVLERPVVPRSPQPETTSAVEEVPTSSIIPTDPTLITAWKRMEDQLRCDICKQLLDVPVSLKCFHTFCSFCIRRYLELSGNDYCPSCRVSSSSTDIRLEPRLAGILNVMGENRGLARKQMRRALRSGACSDPLVSRNETFNRQADLVALVSKEGGTGVTRTLLPLYKNLKDKQLKELLVADGLEGIDSLSRDEMVRHHKEFLFTVQAAYDAVRMGMFPQTTLTKEALAKTFNADFKSKRPLPKSGTLTLRNHQLSESDLRRREADDAESVKVLAQSANARMAQQLREAVLKRKAVSNNSIQ